MPFRKESGICKQNTNTFQWSLVCTSGGYLERVANRGILIYIGKAARDNSKCCFNGLWVKRSTNYGDHRPYQY